MEDRAMRFFNHLGNKFFKYGVLPGSWDSPLKTRCAARKCLSRDGLRDHRGEPGVFRTDFDPFGDFDLIFGAAPTI